MLNKIAIIILSMTTCALAEAKYLHDYLSHIEPLLKEGKFEEAKTEFSKIGRGDIKQKTASGFFETVRYLQGDPQLKRSAYYYRDALAHAVMHPEEYELMGKSGIYGRKGRIQILEYVIEKTPPKNMPFSPEFQKYIYEEYYKKNIEMFNQVSGMIHEHEEKEKQLALETKIKIEKNRKKAQQLAKEKKVREAQEEKEQFNQEIQMVDQACKKAGYKGLAKSEDTPLDLMLLIYFTQQNGGLENYLNFVVGLPKKLADEELSDLYSKTKAIQVLDDSVLYSYSEFTGGEIFTFTALIEREKGKLYQEGQSLEETFYVFNGMKQYRAVTGAMRTIPSFSKAKIKLITEH